MIRLTKRIDNTCLYILHHQHSTIIMYIYILIFIKRGVSHQHHRDTNPKQPFLPCYRPLPSGQHLASFWERDPVMLQSLVKHPGPGLQWQRLSMKWWEYIIIRAHTHIYIYIHIYIYTHTVHIIYIYVCVCICKYVYVCVIKYGLIKYRGILWDMYILLLAFGCTDWAVGWCSDPLGARPILKLTLP